MLAAVQFRRLFISAPLRPAFRVFGDHRRCGFRAQLLHLIRLPRLCLPHPPLWLSANAWTRWRSLCSARTLHGRSVVLTALAQGDCNRAERSLGTRCPTCRVRPHRDSDGAFLRHASAL